jgi:SSS family solute:Na+ symporter
LLVIDYSVIVLYFTAVLGLGFWYKRRASRSLEAYFLGGKRMHWLALAMSGAVSNFDITGTMWIVSMLFLFGMKSMWIHWMWGFMMGAFFLAFMGKWVRRSGVMTGAEWMVTRFGSGRDGVIARTAYAVMAVITQASFIGYAFQGIGKFASVYVGLSPTTCAFIIIGITTIYVLLGGLYSVVVTDVIQTVILTLASILIAAVAFNQLTPEILNNVLPSGWTSLVPKWRLAELAGTENAGYEIFGALVIVWVLKGLFLNAGGPAQMYDFQRFLAARNARDASKVGAAWSLFLIVRWGMATGIVLLALAGIASVTDPEQVMPLVLQEYLPVGVRGLVIAGLLAAFMSTFSSTLNSGASYIVRDIWQPFFRPKADQRSLIRASYVATIGIVIAGILIGYQAQSIAQIWSWMMMALGAGVVIPNVLRWYWWRMNGWGYAAGTVAGILFSVIALFMPELPMYVVFPPIVIASLLASVTVALATPPVDEPILISFYETVRPFGFWKPVQNRCGLSGEVLSDSSESAWRAVMNTMLGMVAITGIYLFPMYLVGHWYMKAFVWLGVALLAAVVLIFTWYHYLPPR